MNFYMAQVEDSKPITYKGVVINVIDNGFGFDYWISTKRGTFRNFGFPTREEAEAQAKQTIDDMTRR